MADNAIGMIETKGYVPALAAADAMVKAANVTIGVTLVDVSMIGVAGRIYLSARTDNVLTAQQEIAAVLGAVAGRDQSEG